MEEVRKIKKLKSHLKAMQTDADVLKTLFTSKQREYNAKLQAIERVKEQIKDIENNNDVRVSEHAIVRYLERVKGLDVEEVKKEILTCEVLELIAHLGGSGSYPNKDFNVVMKNYTVTTII